MKTVAFLGSISSGKSWLSNSLYNYFVEKGLKVEKFFEDPWRNPFFRNFLNNSKDCENTKNMQLWFLNSFLSDRKRAESSGVDIFLSDTYPPVSGRVYTTVQLLSGYLDTERHWEVNKVYDEACSKLPNPEIAVLCLSDKLMNAKALLGRSKEEFGFYLSQPYYLDFLESANRLVFSRLVKEGVKPIFFYNNYDSPDIHHIGEIILESL